ncbi:MAG: hypothetical protein ACXABY_37035 [Candidatus Thorarchaeota archaeon]|jgi:hypothetical protein
MIIHVLHKDDMAVVEEVAKVLCGAERLCSATEAVIWDFTWKEHETDDDWRYLQPTCTACILLALVEPETVFCTARDVSK